MLIGPIVFRGHHGRRKVHDYFLLLLCKSSIWFTEKQIFKIIYFFNTSKFAAYWLGQFIWGIWWFNKSKDFEDIKAGMLAMRPWLSCQYSKNTLMVRLPCKELIYVIYQNTKVSFEHRYIHFLTSFIETPKPTWHY